MDEPARPGGTGATSSTDAVTGGPAPDPRAVGPQSDRVGDGAVDGSPGLTDDGPPGATGDGPSGEVADGPQDVPLSQTRAGRRLLNVLAVVLLAAMLISNLPSELPFRDRLVRFEQPITDVTGLSQNWALFAPNPRSTTLRLRAEIERADGTVTEWIPPVGDPVLGVYRTYRWRKWAGSVVGPRASALHRGAVHHLTARFGDEGAEIVEIRLYRGVQRNPGAGSGEPLDRTPTFTEELLLRSVVSEARP